MSNEEEQRNEGKEYKIDLRDTEKCDHEFYRDGLLVKCKKCTVEYYDPEQSFPIA